MPASTSCGQQFNRNGRHTRRSSNDILDRATPKNNQQHKNSDIDNQQIENEIILLLSHVLSLYLPEILVCKIRTLSIMKNFFSETTTGTKEN